MNIARYIYKRKYVYLYFDNGDLHKIYIPVFEKNYYKINTPTFNEESLQDLLYQNDLFMAKDKVLSYLTSRSKSKKEIVLYLKKRSFSEKIIKEILDYCEEMNLIDEEDFAEKYVRELARKRKGPYFIRQKLIEKGISMDNFDEYIRQIYSKDEIETNIEYLIEKKMKSLKKIEINVAKGKILNYLLRLGYVYDDIKKVLKNFF